MTFAEGSSAAIGWGVSITAIVVAIVSGVFAVWQARISAKNRQSTDQAANTTAVIEVGIKDLITQYREANEELRDDVHECLGRCEALERENNEVHRKLDELGRELNHKDELLHERDAQLIQYKRRVGELP